MMSINDFDCDKCGTFEDLAKPGETVNCPVCGKASKRVYTTPPSLDYLHMGVDACGNPTSGDKWARMHETQALLERNKDNLL